MIKFLIGGSPCTHWSIAQSKEKETEPEGIGWELFENYLIAKEKFRPDFFLYENNKSISQAIRTQISQELKVPLQYINSATVSAQNRWRLYAHNIPRVPQPKDRHVALTDILENGAYPVGTTKDKKSYCLTASYSRGSNIKQTLGQGKRTLAAERIEAETHEIAEKSKTYKVRRGGIVFNGVRYKTNLPDGLYLIRSLTVTECCRLQTLPDDYCRVAKKTNAYKGLGNGWTAEVIIHILSYALAGIPKDEEIMVLSMYDGIGTGRYCFEKLGFKNVHYYAYEIEKTAIEIALSNYPDIVQCGDAFQLRNPEWALPRVVRV